MKTRTMNPEQLNVVFAESLQETKPQKFPIHWRRPMAWLYKAKGREASGFVTRAADASSSLEAAASGFNHLGRHSTMSFDNKKCPA